MIIGLLSCSVLILLQRSTVSLELNESVVELRPLKEPAQSVIQDVVNVPKNHSYTLGCWSKYHREHIKKSAKLFWRIVTADCEVPASDVFPKGVIRYITVNDLNNKGEGGYASLVHGGIDSTRAMFHLTSEPGKPLDYIIEFYGF